MESITQALKDAGYQTVTLVDDWIAHWVPPANNQPGKHVPRKCIDLHVAPAEGPQVVGKDGTFAALGILKAAGISFNPRGVRVFNNTLIVRDITNNAKTPANK